MPQKHEFSGDNEANIMGKILAHNRSISEINLSYHSISIDGLTSLQKGCVGNDILTRVNINGNFIGPEASPVICELIKGLPNLEYLNVANMDLEYEGIRSIQQVITELEKSRNKKIFLYFEGNFV